jgi:hypothetical protein
VVRRYNFLPTELTATDLAWRYISTSMDYLTVKGLIPIVSLTLFRSSGVVMVAKWSRCIAHRDTTKATISGSIRWYFGAAWIITMITNLGWYDLISLIYMWELPHQRRPL